MLSRRRASDCVPREGHVAAGRPANHNSERNKLYGICRQTQERPRREAKEIIFYDDRYHSVAAHQGVFILYRRVPAFILRASGQYYACAATRLSIVLPAPAGERINHQGCVRVERGFRHPLAQQSGELLMDRCDNDITKLQRSAYPGDLCGALIKHLNDARLMLEIGYEKAPPPGRALSPISRAGAERLGCPVYHYRQAA